MSLEHGTRRPNPFVGPSPLQPGQPLYGRDRELFELRNLLIAERIVVLYSPSGAGKTSLIRAGLIEMLRQAEFHVLPVISLGQPPEADGVSGRNRYLQSTIRSLEEDIPDAEQVELKHLPLYDYLDQRPRGPGVSKTDLLIFDQFEQILTLDPVDSEVKTEFFKHVGEVLRAGDRWALFALREDHLAGLDPYRRWIPRRLTKAFRLEFMNPAAAREAIRRTAEHGGVEFAADAADQLVTDLSRVHVQQLDGSVKVAQGQDVEPVQLQVVCHRLWNHLPLEEDRIGLELVEQYGKVSKALGAFYTESVAQVALKTGIPESDIRAWFGEHLITKQGIRGQVLKEVGESAGLGDQAIKALIDTHLVRAESRRGLIWFELAHDRLIEPIRASNDAWYQVNLNAFQQQARLWQSQGRVPGYFLADEALAQAELWAATQVRLTDTERAYLEESIQHQRAQDAERLLLREARARQQAEEAARHEAEQRVADQALAARRLRRWLQIAAVLAGLAGILALASGYWAWYSHNQELEARSRWLAGQVDDVKEDQPALAVLLGLEALKSANTFEARNVLLEQIADGPIATLNEGDGVIHDLAFVPGTDAFVSVDSNSNVRLWSIERVPIAEAVKHARGAIRSIAFSPDGRLFATGGAAGVDLWEVKTLEARSFSNNDVRSVAFSPDGTAIAANSADGAITLFDAETGVGRRVCSGRESHDDGINVVAFFGAWIAIRTNEGNVLLCDKNDVREPISLEAPVSSNPINAIAADQHGEQLAVADGAGTIRIWRVADERDGPDSVLTNGSPLDKSDGQISDLAFSEDGDNLVVTHDDGFVTLWDVHNKSMLRSFDSPGEGETYSAAFSSDGTILASGNADGIIHLWNAEGPSLAIAPPENVEVDDVTAVAFALDGSRLAIGNESGSVRWCDRAPGSLTCETVLSSVNPIRNVVFSLHGNLLAIGDNSGAVSVLMLESNQLRNDLHADSGIAALSFDPSGSMLAAVTDSAMLEVWNLQSETQVEKVKMGNFAGSALAFGSSGQYLAAGDTGGTVYLWSVREGAVIQREALFTTLDPVSNLSFDQTDTVLAAGTSGTSFGKVFTWNLKSELPRIEERLDSPVAILTINSDSRMLASGQEDGSVRLWDLDFNKQIESLGTLDGAVKGMTWTRSGTIIVVAANGSMHELDAREASWLDRACLIVGDNVDILDGEADMYFNDPNYRGCPFETLIAPPVLTSDGD